MRRLNFLLAAQAALLTLGCAGTAPELLMPPVADAAPVAVASVAATDTGSISEKSPGAAVTRPDFILVDTRRDAFSTYRALSAGADAAELQTAAGQAGASARVQLLAWDLFAGAPDKQVSGRLVRNDYPEINIEQSLIELLRRYPGKTFGITWNGGLAVTAAQFKYAEQTLAINTSRPGGFVREPNAQDDPVYPLTRITRMLRTR